MMKDAASSQGDAEERDKEMNAIVIDRIDSNNTDGRNTPGFNNREAEIPDDIKELKDSHEKRMDEIFEMADEQDDQ